MNISSGKKSMSLSIKSKLLLFILCISLIPIAIITTLYYVNTRSILTRNELNDLTAIAVSKKYHVLSILHAKRDRTVDFSSDGFIRDSLYTINHGDLHSRKEATIALNEHLSASKKPLDHHIMEIDILDLNGKVVASTNEKLIEKEVYTKEVFTRNIDKIYDEPYISAPHYNPYLKEIILDIYCPITSLEDVRPSGILINHYNLAVLNEITTTHIEMGESGEVLLGMKSGDNIVFLTSLRYVPDAPLNLSVRMNSHEAEPMRLALKGGSGTVIAHDYRGVDVVSAYQHFPMMDWGLVAKKDKKEIFAPFRILTIIAIIIVLVSAAIIIGVSIVFAISISRPIWKLAHGADRIAGGDLGHKIKISRKDEIGALASSFETMRIQLGKSMKNIEEGRKDWESTFDSVRDIIILWDKDCRLIRCNKALLEGLKVKPEEILGKKCYEIFQQIKKEDLSKCAVIGMPKDLKPVTYEIEVRCLGGIFSISSFPRFDNKGEFVGTVQVMRDTTERKQAEERLQLHSYQQEEITNIGRHALVGTDLFTLMKEIVAIVANTLDMEFCKVLELLPDGQSLLLRAGVGWKEGYVGHATVGTNTDSQAGYTLLSNEPVIVEDLRTETRFRGPQLLNDHGVISGMSVVIQSKNRPFGVLGVHTSRQRAFDKNDAYFLQAIANVLAEAIERKEMEIQFRSIVDNSADGIITINEKGIIKSFNPAAEKLFGYTAAETICRNIKMLMPEPYHSEHDDYLQHYISTGKGCIIGIGPREVLGLRSDGKTFPMELGVGEMRIGEQRMFVGILRDSTKRKEMEKNLKESYKMASLGKLTAGVSHEILNPLNIISSYAQLLLTDTKKGSKTEKDLKKILEEVDRIVKITDSLLGFSRRGKLQVEEVEINNLLKNILTITEPEIKLKNIKVLARFEEGLPKLMASGNELRQVFLNLITNAKDAMPEGGNLTISTQSIEKRGKPFVSIKFNDTGKGISEKNIGNLFDPFFTTKVEGEGTGLGLSISYGIIKNHGGKMSVNSKEGKGATFIIDLPIKD